MRGEKVTAGFCDIKDQCMCFQSLSHLIVALWVVDAGDGVCGVEIVERGGQKR